MSKSMTQLITLLVVISIIVGLVLLLPLSIQNRSEDLRCKARLSRLGIATNQFVIDSGRSRFPPPITNPQQGQLWLPDRPNGIEHILAMYLQGDISVPQRDGESNEAYLERRRRTSFAVDPTSGLPFWYNESLRGRNPQRFMTAAEQRTWYFSAQRLPDGSYPYAQQGQSGVYTVDGVIVVSQITPEEIDQFEEEVLLRRQEDPTGSDVVLLNQALQRYRNAQQRAGNQAITLFDLEHDVRFEAR